VVAVVAAVRRVLPPLLVFFALTGVRSGRAQEPSTREDLPPPPVVRKAAGLKEWVDGGVLRFRVDAITGCGAGARAANERKPAPPPDAGTVELDRAIASRPPLARVAFSVRIIAGPGEVFVSPRDVTLEAGGVILQTTDPKISLGRGCGPTLTPRRLGARQTARGLLIFEVSPEFRASGAPMVLAYRPTRWGGAGRLEVKVPGCLEACKD
jgi:hypothetical protein